MLQGVNKKEISTSKIFESLKVIIPRKRRGVFAAGTVFFCLVAVVVIRWEPANVKKPTVTPNAFRPSLSAALAEPLQEGKFPDHLPLSLEGHLGSVHVNYTIQTKSQEAMEKLLKIYKPDYGAFVALEADTGRILSLCSYTAQPSSLGNLALRSSFPAASLFKIVTATAALEGRSVTPETEITFNGANHTLYRRNVTDSSSNRWTRTMTLKEAFAKSVNTVFAKLGLYKLKGQELEDYAHRFQFNRFIASDLPIQPGQFLIPDKGDWGIAEAASGFNRVVTLSPLQAVMMAASVVNDGVMMSPYIVDSINPVGQPMTLAATKQVAAVTMTPETAAELRQLMQETVESGTSRKSFRTLLKNRKYEGLEIGGKTGSMTGLDPKGKYDWFIGYAKSSDGKKIAVSALTINEETWKVKSSFLAREFFEQYFKPPPRTP